MNSARSLLAALVFLVACDLPSEAQTQAQTQIQTPTQHSQPSQTKAPAKPAARDPYSGLRWVTRQEIPAEGQKVLVLISKGGPFRYSKDGVTFGNRERLLPQKARGYYREYTVPTPGESDRGARRIVCGGAATSLKECYYTADHYASFRRIRP